jgi:TonB family protein
MHRLALGALVSATLAGPAAAQTVAGLALDDSTRAPIGGSAVRLLDARRRVVAEGRTNADGSFYLTAPGAGTYHLSLRRAEGGAFRGAALRLGADSVVQHALAVPLLPAPLRAVPTEQDVDAPAAALPGRGGPRYPAGPRRRRERGTVVSFLVVGPDGRVDLDAQHHVGTHPDFVAAVREAVPRLRFAPARRAGQPVAQLVQQTFAFGFAGDALDGDVVIQATGGP